MMTQDEYIASRGAVCPFCESDEIESHFVEVDNGIARQEMRCPECDAEWEAEYALTGYRS